MLLTVTNTARPATDLGFLLHKHPGRVQEFRQSSGGEAAWRVHEPVFAVLALESEPVDPRL
ncbi:RNA repair, ligase-Pnkp-associating, region of Hen1 [Nonomuraea coxensis DSM 45129]|uniref:RNA repair, ligase-Pnkp-associating, region of Hen1 n=1 Tax=Nonomuraea coxensis DSM 45129 TaxID=1122611 RepID=A0ABX8U7G3_9ACTN|nr:hypothetical protein [Nonomuraea coxensis]QYC43623.1 RNA repair, ligase-Pnkp-associating, region of Hen1 [Nonomuraea coxensis DSM 45129]